MVHFAHFLNRSHTDEYSPVFETIYAIEFLLILCVFFIFPLTVKIALNAVPFHRNLRYIFVCQMFHAWIGSISREWEITMAFASITRRIFLFYFIFVTFGIAIERLVATLYWSWYEQQGRHTLLIVIANVTILDGIAIFLSYLQTTQPELFEKPENTLIIFSFFVILMANGGVMFILVFLYNLREVAKLSRRGANRYSLARSFQLRENVDVMKIILRLVLPIFVIAAPSLIFLTAYLFLPLHFNFYRLLSIAIFDCWTSGVTLIVSIGFPFTDQRFRRSANRFRLFRFLMPNRFADELITTTMADNRVGHTDHYFDWLNRDLR